jgi:hypothetical protein
MTSHSISGRDPVCELIESMLRRLEKNGMGRFEISQGEGGIQVSFSGMKASAVNLDIALVRLAKTMMDDVMYQATLMETLRRPLLTS